MRKNKSEYMKLRKRTMLNDAIDFVSFGVGALFKDDFTKCFKSIPPEELDGSGVFYIFSLLIRYCFLLPLRILGFLLGTLIFVAGFVFTMVFKNDERMQFLFLFYVRVFTFSFGANIKHHGIKRKLDRPHVFVANHTSFLDFLVLSSHKFCHAIISQAHGGLFGLLFKLFLSKNGSLLFKRSDKNDSNRAFRMMNEHVKKNKTPMLIFPEGTCVNNKYSVLFQKGAFDLDVTVCPVAIKYRKSLLDPYWNTSKHTFFVHLLYLMSRWKLDVEVYWLEPLNRLPGESSSNFAMRTKNIISEKAELKNVLWNGRFKSTPVLKDREILREAFKSIYNDHVKIEKEKMRYIYKIKSSETRMIPYEDEICDIESEENDENVFYNYNYNKYLNSVLKQYLRFKNNPDLLNNTFNINEDGILKSANDIIWLDSSARCNCIKKKDSQKNHFHKKKSLDVSNKPL